MFNNQRCVTRGVINDIPATIQAVMWLMIETQTESKKKVDYLQVFRLDIRDGQQIINHSQEKPKRKSELILLLDEPPVYAKIFVIDDGEHSTMMLAEEY